MCRLFTYAIQFLHYAWGKEYKKKKNKIEPFTFDFLNSEKNLWNSWGKFYIRIVKGFRLWEFWSCGCLGAAPIPYVQCTWYYFEPAQSQPKGCTTIVHNDAYWEVQRASCSINTSKNKCYYFQRVLCDQVSLWSKIYSMLHWSKLSGIAPNLLQEFH